MFNILLRAKAKNCLTGLNVQEWNVGGYLTTHDRIVKIHMTGMWVVN